MSLVLYLIGSDSDLKIFDKSKVCEILEAVGVEWELSVLSAHRHKKQLEEYVESKTGLIRNSTPIFIAAAGMAAHLPGVIAACKRLVPVFGVALPSDGFPDAQDAALSIYRMPPGVPVGFYGIGEAGLYNATIAACQILALRNVDLVGRLQTFLERTGKKHQIGVRSNLNPRPPQENSDKGGK
jgi:5-(carboxyamino)imidazole ribonucleotide mutase